MLRDEVCLCGHSLSFHRTYGCTGTRPNLDRKKTDQCKTFNRFLYRCKSPGPMGAPHEGSVPICVVFYAQTNLADSRQRPCPEDFHREHEGETDSR
jgi:hypothetical protein